MPADSIVTADDLSRFSRTELIAQSVIDSFVSGMHKSPYKGFALDFSHYRAYTRGDEMKHLDWNVYARTNKYYVKLYDEYAVLKAYILLDASGSMNYGSGDITKYQFARFIAAVLTHILISQRDSVGLITFDTKMRDYLPPASTSSQLMHILSNLNELEPGGETSLGGILGDLSARLKRRGLIILISDLFDQPEQIRGALTHFSKRKHELVVFRILDPAERDFPFKKFARFVDLESGSHLFTEPSRIRREYIKNFLTLEEDIRRTCFELGADYVPVYTDKSPAHALARYLSLRTSRK